MFLLLKKKMKTDSNWPASWLIKFVNEVAGVSFDLLSLFFLLYEYLFILSIFLKVWIDIHRAKKSWYSRDLFYSNMSCYITHYIMISMEKKPVVFLRITIFYQSIKNWWKKSKFIFKTYVKWHPLWLWSKRKTKLMKIHFEKMIPFSFVKKWKCIPEVLFPDKRLQNAIVS